MIYFRCDMNDNIATGHIMRCLSIADAAKISGEESVFIFADEIPLKYVNSRGYRGIVLGTPWNALSEEIPAMCALIEKERISTLLVDSYAASPQYLNSLSQKTNVFYIDDLGIDACDAAGIICYGPQYKRLGFDRKFPEEKLFLGPSYTPLRREFADCGRKSISQKARNLLLMSGGSDAYNMVGNVLETMQKGGILSEYDNIWAVCGMFHDGYQALSRIYGKERQVHILRSTPDIKKYMEKADIAISAGGTTILELCAVGTPTIAYTIADNQVESIKSLAEQGLVHYAGDARENKNLAEKIAEKLTALSSDRDRREQMSRKMQRTVDGQGAVRILTAVLNYAKMGRENKENDGMDRR